MAAETRVGEIGDSASGKLSSEAYAHFGALRNRLTADHKMPRAEKPTLKGLGQEAWGTRKTEERFFDFASRTEIVEERSPRRRIRDAPLRMTSVHCRRLAVKLVNSASSAE